jgi:hypothetical protein
MPFRYLGDLRGQNDLPLYGNGDCVELIKALVPELKQVHASSWKKAPG